jgi:hypothetical protein
MSDLFFCRFQAPGPLWWRRASSSRSGRTQFHLEIYYFDQCLITSCICMRFKQVSIFHWFPCSGPSWVLSCPPWPPPRKISADSPDFEFSYYNLMPFIYGQRFCWENRQFLPPDISLTKPSKPDEFTYTFLDKRLLERIRSCSTSASTSIRTSIGIGTSTVTGTSISIGTRTSTSTSTRY